MRRFDYGLNGIIGFQLKDVMIGLNYGYGWPSYNQDRTIQRIITISFRLPSSNFYSFFVEIYDRSYNITNTYAGRYQVKNRFISQIS